MAVASASWNTPSKVAAFFPDAEGSPKSELTSGLTNEEREPPQPFAVGTA